MLPLTATHQNSEVDSPAQGTEDPHAAENPKMLTEIIPPLTERTYLIYQELQQVLMSGDAARKHSGLVPSHIDAIMEVLREEDAAVGIRRVNPYAAFWIIFTNAHVKGLDIKNKTEKGGPLPGLLLVHDDTEVETLDRIDGKIYAILLKRLFQENRLHILPNSPAAKADTTQHTLTVQDEDNAIHELRFDKVTNQCQIFRKTDDGFSLVRFRAEEGKPVTADDDVFDWYPRLKNRKFSGFKDIDTSTIASSSNSGEPSQQTGHGKGKFYSAIQQTIQSRHAEGSKLFALTKVILDQVLDRSAVEKEDPKWGRLTGWDMHLLTQSNNRIEEQSGYQGRPIKHGKEKHNWKYATPCNEVFFMHSRFGFLMSQTWEETQAIDAALRHEGLVSTDNRAYNKVTEDGKFISWNPNAAAKKIYAKFANALATPAQNATDPAGKGKTKTAGMPERIDSASEAILQQSAVDIPVWLDHLWDRARSDFPGLAEDDVTGNAIVHEREGAH